MQRIELDNFRVFGSPASFDLAPVTVLTGKNNSGKSSLIKAFLVLADYLEQDDQTVLRLDGPRAGRHRISEWGNLRNWYITQEEEYQWHAGKEDYEPLQEARVKLGYTQGDVCFTYEFEDSGSRRPANLFRFCMAIPNIGELNLKSIGGGVYQLDVAQKFINYLTGTPVEQAKLREAAGYETRLVDIRREIIALDIQLNTPDATGSNYAQAVQKRQELQNTVRNLEALSARSKTVAGIHFQSEIWPDDAPQLTLAGMIQAALTKYIEADGEEEDEEEENDEQEGEEDYADVDPDELTDEYWQAHRDMAQLSRAMAEDQQSQQQFATLNAEEGRRILVQFPQVVEQAMRFKMEHLSANRTYQARLYLTGNHHAEINTIAEAFQRAGIFKEGSAMGFLEKWLPRFGIGDRVKIQLLESAALRIEVMRGEKRINLADLGFGAGQILTILLQIAALVQIRDEQALSNKTRDHSPTLVLIEEPEANLHPQFQSQLAELFSESAQRYGFRFVIETHSEYLIRNVQVIVKEQLLLSSFKVYYLDQPSEANGHKYGHEMRLREDGAFLDKFGDGFLDVARKLAFEIL